MRVSGHLVYSRKEHVTDRTTLGQVWPARQAAAIMDGRTAACQT
jgi:hypothetical protein